MRRDVRLLLAIVTLVAIVVASNWFHATSSASEAVDALGRPILVYPQGLVSTAKAIGLLLLGGWLMGLIASDIGFSRITGYLVFGILASPRVGAWLLGQDTPWLLSSSQQSYLTLVNDVAIVLIALTAGSKINLSEVRQRLASITLILAFEFVIVLAAITTLMAVMLSRTDAFAAYGGTVTTILVALVIGVVATANSPAVVIAVLNETRADGPLARTALAVTVWKDLVLIVVFAVALALAVSAAAAGLPAAEAGEAVTGAGPAQGGKSIWLKVTRQIGGSMALGGGIGVLLAWYVRRGLEHPALILTLGAFAITLVSEALGLKPLVVGLAAGLLIANRFAQQKRGLQDAIEELSVPVYVLFFAVAGTKVDPALVSEVWGFVLGLVVLRIGAVWAGTTLGCRVSRVEKPAGRWMWTAFVPQAGISLALTVVVAEQFRGFGFADQVYAVLLSAIAFNELVGPILFKHGLVRAGEVGRLA
ncbi:MAG: cation:proton antiporter [Phycisphaerales bacterium]|nr:cation:proton antiporter [Phycisphaerales bacterium]